MGNSQVFPKQKLMHDNIHLHTYRSLSEKHKKYVLMNVMINAS